MNHRGRFNNTRKIMTYALHLQRVIDEKAALDDKAKKLSAFIGENPLFEQLDAAEQEHMKVQNDLMWQYFVILGPRIAAFTMQTNDNRN